MKYTALHLIITLLVAIVLPIFVAISVSHSKSIHVDVEGLVCDFCAQSIEKVFMKQPGVKVVYVNLDRGNVQIKMADIFEKDEDGISDIRIRKLFEDAGYNVTNITRK